MTDALHLRHTFLLAAALAAAGSLILRAPAGAQVTMLSSTPPAGISSVEARADSLASGGERGESLALLDRWLKDHPNDYRAHMLAARDAFWLGYAEMYKNWEGSEPWLRRAASEADWALGVAPHDPTARYTKLAATGLLGLVKGGRESARLAVVVDTAARSLIADDSTNAGAHNILGRLYEKIAGLSWMDRLVGGRWLGKDLLSRSTWSAAEHELRLATELAPDVDIYHLDLGVFYLKKGRRDEARAALEAAVRAPLQEPEQKLARDHARRLLADMDGR